MATVTKTYTENHGTTYKSTWTVEVTGNNVTATDSSVSLGLPTVRAKYVHASKNSAYSMLYYALYVGGAEPSILSFFRGGGNIDNPQLTATTTNTFYNVPYVEGTAYADTSDIFNSGNSTTRTVNITASILDETILFSGYGSGDVLAYSANYQPPSNINIGTIGTVTLNAPPTFTVSPLGKDTAGGYYKDHTVVSVTVSDVDVKYGGTLSSVVFTIGEQSTGALSATTFYIRLNAIGTFTPTVAVTDSRGQTKTISLPAITVTYAPPSCTATVTSSAPYINNYSAYTVNITNASAPDGTVSEIKLTVGGQSATRSNNGTLSVTPTTNGTYTPTVIIKDSNNMTTTYTLSQITVRDADPPTFDVSATTTAPYVRTKNSYTVSITNATATYGGTATNAILNVGSQSATGTISGGSCTLTINPLNTAGSITPSVTVTDNRGLSTTKSLSSITVLDYNVPSMNMSVIRCNSSGVADDEGTYGLITAQITYSNARCNLTKPTMTVRNQSGTAVSTTQTWYSNSSLTTAVNWTNYNPNSPVTLYCLLAGSFNEQAYNIECYVKDSLNGQSGTITQTLPPTFYTVDYQAGGKEIAFGEPANDTLTSIHGKDVSSYGYFKCGMEAQFNHDVWANGDVNVASGKHYKINGTNISASDVGALASTTTYVSGVKGNAESSYRSGNVNVTPANVGAVALADKYTRSSNGTLDWSTTTEGDAKVIAKSALAFWNGAYSGNSSNLSKCSTGDIIGSNGGTMTGQLKTSFKTSVAMGSYGSAQSTVPNFVAEVRYSSGCAGSVNFTSNYTANNVTIAGGWYNFMYMPHRSGGNSGADDGDNANYGNLFLFGMNNTNGRFIVRVSSGSIADVCRIWTSLETVDYVVEQGTSGIWTYRKWNSGVAECWGIYSASIAVNTASAGYGGYRSSEITATAYPFTFISIPIVTATCGSGSNSAHVVNVQGSTVSNCKFYLGSGASSGAASRSIHIHAIGKWK